MHFECIGEYTQGFPAAIASQLYEKRIGFVRPAAHKYDISIGHVSKTVIVQQPLT
jgi:hypothetical protein